MKVQLTAADLGGLEGLIDKAEQARIENASYGAIVRISHGGRTLGMDDAYAKANRIKELNTAFSTQASDLERNLDYLGQQRERLADLLDQLTSEQAEFQTKILQLDQEPLPVCVAEEDALSSISPAHGVVAGILEFDPRSSPTMSARATSPPPIMRS